MSQPLPEFLTVEFDERATKADRVAVSSWLTHQRHHEARLARDAKRYADNREQMQVANRARWNDRKDEYNARRRQGGT